MSARLKWLLLSVSVGSLSLTGCVSYGQRHAMTPRAVYVAPPEGIPVKNGGLLYGRENDLKRIDGKAVIPSGWLIVSPE